LPKPEKVSFVQDFNQQLSKAQICILVNCKGLTVSAVNTLRRKLEKTGKIEMKVVKNTLAGLACKDTKFEVLTDKLTGPNAFVIGYEEPVSPSKALIDFKKDVPALEIRGGAFNGEWLSFEKLTALSKLPSKSELHSILAGVLIAPIRNVALALSAVPKGLVTVLAALRDKKEKEAA